ncbi:hypothetical protein GcC1_055043, partial [Golovinomyces cichoracearum]
ICSFQKLEELVSYLSFAVKRFSGDLRRELPSLCFECTIFETGLVRLRKLSFAEHCQVSLNIKWIIKVIEELILKFESLKLQEKDMATKTYPTFHICGKYDGSIPAIRWLNQLHGELRPHYTLVTADVFFEAISMLFVGEAGEWLDSSPEFIEFIDKEKEPNAKDIEEFKQAVTKRFPRKKVESDVGNVQEDIQNLQQELN